MWVQALNLRADFIAHTCGRISLHSVWLFFVGGDGLHADGDQPNPGKPWGGGERGAAWSDAEVSWQKKNCHKMKRWRNKMKILTFNMQCILMQCCWVTNCAGWWWTMSRWRQNTTAAKRLTVLGSEFEHFSTLYWSSECEGAVQAEEGPGKWERRYEQGRWVGIQGDP